MKRLASVVGPALGALLLASCSAASGSGSGMATDGDTTPMADGAVGADGAVDSGVGADSGGADSGTTMEVCDGLDNDGDGRVDELCGCELGQSQDCYPGDPTLAGVGACELGSQTCIESGVEFGTWGACTGASPPGPERCDGVDNSCDGVVDEGCECEEGATRPCYDGPDGTLDVGICAGGLETCEAGADGLGTSWGGCIGASTPAEESCNGVDDDCSGAADEGCACADSETRPCYTGPAGTDGVGPCFGGVQYCIPGAGGESTWGACEGDMLPTPDVCNGVDDDCDGTPDQDCLCPPGTARPCWTAGAEERGVGACRDGVQACELAPTSAGSSWGTCEGAALPAAEICNGTDDDCDGLLDEGCSCRSGDVRTCYSGPLGSGGVGVCRTGSQTCELAADGSTSAWGTCSGEVMPGDEVCFDGIDGDCDGVIDDGCACGGGESRGCYAGPLATRGVGTCRDGSQVCVVEAGGAGSDWGACGGSVLPVPEVCDGLDNDCDGAADEGCSCVPGSTRGCYTGSGGSEGVGLCRAGTQECELAPDGMTTSWGTCADVVLPAGESCDGLDNDCDGVVDDGCDCTGGATRPCYVGDGSTRGVGECADGAETCEVGAGGIGSAWGSCVGSSTPATELCDGLDNDCNGATDEGCLCTERTVRACYTGPAGSEGVGACIAGVQTCILAPDGASTSWGTCGGAVLPDVEVCNGADDDCDGVVDDGCECVPGSIRGCYGGPAASRGLGICSDGTQVCVAGPGGVGSSWGACSGDVTPSVELCDGIDNDCDGLPDETCACTDGDTRVCYSGPPATRGVGECGDGVQACSFSGGSASWGACSGEQLPVGETCDGTDEDCDGLVDEGVCAVPPTVMCPADMSTRPLVPVTLVGSASDADGVIASWRWTLLSSPVGSSGTFSSPTSSTTDFTPNLVGLYTIRLEVTDDDGLTASCTVTVTATGEGIRIEVLWNRDAADVDTHLLRMAGGSAWFSSPNDCYYANSSPSWDAAGTADDPRLDIDDVDGFGPENMNLDVPVTGNTYRVGVHYYSDHGAGGTEVTVRIYCGDIAVTPEATYVQALSNGASGSTSNDFWRVADVQWNGGDSCTVSTLGTITTGSGATSTP